MNKEVHHKEIWKIIPGYDEVYEISSLGRVRRVKEYDVEVFPEGRKSYMRTRRPGFLKVHIPNNDKAYPKITLYHPITGLRMEHYIHRLVAEAFIPNPDNKPEINHIDSNRHNFSLNNLEWVTRSENVIHAYENNQIDKSKIKYVEPTRITLREIYSGEETTFNSIKEASEVIGTSIRCLSARLKGRTNIATPIKGYLVVSYKRPFKPEKTFQINEATDLTESVLQLKNKLKKKSLKFSSVH